MLVNNFRVPGVILDNRPEYVELYQAAWRLAAEHIKDIPGLPAVHHMDEGFDPSRLWIWDTCFMVHFCKYAPKDFPGIESLDNFYLPMLDGVESPCLIHHPDNPPLFAWTEYEYWRFTGDNSRLHRNLVEKKYLQRHYEFMENLCTGDKFSFSHVQANFHKIDRGYMWSGCASGMDNTPRGEDMHCNILWLDALAQMALSALYIAGMAAAIGETAIETDYTAKYQAHVKLLNDSYFDERDGSYYDLWIANYDYDRILTPASFWPLLAEAASPERAGRQIAVLENPELLGGKVPVTTVARNSRYFKPDGRYWRGSIWLPESYMVMRALVKYGRFDLAAELAERTVTHMTETFRNFSPATIWECYSPTEAKPALDKHGEKLVRPDFCGWSALGPISMLIENILGFYNVDAIEKVVKYHYRPIGRHGITDFCFGQVCCDIIIENDGKIHVKSNHPFELELNNKRIPCPAGTSIIDISA